MSNNYQHDDNCTKRCLACVFEAGQKAERERIAKELGRMVKESQLWRPIAKELGRMVKESQLWQLQP